MLTMRLLPVVLTLCMVGLLCLLPGPWPSNAWAGTTTLTWLDQVDAGSQDFERAIAPDQVHFPEAYGPHPNFQTEWWYYTGNLETETGRPFGYQLTFFRSAVVPETEPKAAVETSGQSEGLSSHLPSAWRGKQLYSAHFTLSDIEGDRFYPHERYSRGGVGLAGAMAQPYQVWLEDWSASEIEPSVGEQLGKVRLQAQSDNTAIDLVVDQMLSPVLQGDRGLSQKGIEPGNASYYYSLVQQPTAGSVTVGDTTYPVNGITWKDHEYSTSALSPGTVGWDWFSLQFDDGTALMLYGLRHEDGRFEPTSGGTFVNVDGSTEHLELDDFEITVKKTWKSTGTQAVYPAAWAIAIPKLELQLQGQAQMANQELRTGTATYWEGAVAFEGSVKGESVVAQGYAELTGYADRLDSILAASR